VSRCSVSAGRRALGAATGALLAATCLAACGGAGPTVRPAVTGTVPTPTPSARAVAPEVARSRPIAIKIPKLGVSAPVTQLGLQADGSVEEPPLSRPNLAGWYEKGPTPGEKGPAVILGHVDAHRQAAVFYDLKKLRPGDRIMVTRADKSVITFTVQRLQQVQKSNFPSNLVYGEVLDYASLRLVTCGGDFNRRTGHYVSNVIAFARMVTSA
jgi:LPXTG-site transpeptidase (sortase) family protein